MRSPSTALRQRGSALVGHSKGTFDWARAFLAIGGLIGLVSVFSLPVLGPMDEGSHLIRVATISKGYLVAPAYGEHPVGYEVDGCLWSYLVRARALALPTPVRQAWKDHSRNGSCGDPHALTGGGEISGAELDSPVPYLPDIAGYIVGRAIDGAAGGVFGARLAQFLSYLVLCWFALKIVPWGKPFVFTLALLPVSIQGASGVNPDAVTLSLSFAVLAGVLRCIFRSEHDKTVASNLELGGLGVAFIVLSLCKPATLPLIALVALVPGAVFADVWSRRKWIVGTIGGAAATGGAWALLVGSKVRVTRPGIDSAASRAWLQEHLSSVPGMLWHTATDAHAVRWFSGGIIAPLQIDQSLPLWLTVLCLLGLVFARSVDPVPSCLIRAMGTNAVESLTADEHAPPPGRVIRERIVAALVLIAGLIVITYGIFISFNAPGARSIRGIQGRYLLPYAPLCLFGARPTVRWNQIRVAAFVCAAALLCLNLWWLVRVMSRWHLLP